MSERRLRDNIAGYLFIGPALILIGIFSVFPVFFTLYVSLWKWRPGGPAGFLGLGNYAELFGGNPLWLLCVLASIGGFVLAAFLFRVPRGGRGGRALPRAGGALVLAASVAGFVVFLPYLVAQGDKEVFDSIRVTIWYSIGTVPLQLAVGMLLAVLLSQKVVGKQAFRVVYLIPYIAPSVATAAIFELLLSLRNDSFANQLIGLFGAKPLQWLQEPKGVFQLLFSGAPMSAAPGAVIPAYWSEWAQGPSLALVAIIIYSLWVFIGYYALIYLNGLSNIPRQLYEAAEVDGAGRVRSFFSITVPLLSPTTYMLSILGIIGTFKAFTHLFVLRHSAAGGAVDPVSVSIFFTFFRKSRLGYASAVSLLLFAIVLGLTAIQRRTEKRVNYGD